MQDSPGIAATRRFLQLATEGESPSLEALARGLDELALAYHDTPEGEPSKKDAQPPGSKYADRRARLQPRFPELGFYASVSPKEELEEAGYGDALDDLADIVGELEEVLWRDAQLGSDDANWHFRWLYQIHWGRHLRDLSLYLHVKQFGGW